MLDIVASYHCMQFQGKRIIQTQENGKKTYLGPDLGPLRKNSGRQFSFQIYGLFIYLFIYLFTYSFIYLFIYLHYFKLIQCKIVKNN